MTSPAVMPARSAGVAHRSPRTRVPLLTGAIVLGTPAFWSLGRHAWPEDGLAVPEFPWPSCSWRCWDGLVADLARCDGNSTPMNPVAPILIVELPLPLSICRAMVSARLIGIAK